MRQTVVYLVVAHGGHIRPQDIHQVDGGKAAVFRVDDGAAEQIARDGIQDVFLLGADLLDVARQAGQAAHLVLADLPGHKIAVQIVGVQDRQFCDLVIHVLPFCQDDCFSCVSRISAAMPTSSRQGRFW